MMMTNKKQNRYRYFMCDCNPESEDAGVWRLDTELKLAEMRNADGGHREAGGDNWDVWAFEDDRELTKEEANDICRSWGHSFSAGATPFRLID